MSNESISSHLIELRSRLIRVIICLGILSIVGIPFASEIYSFVASPLLNILPEGSSMIATQVTSPFMAPIKLVLFVALLVTMPYLFYEVWMFMSPGLYKNEKILTSVILSSSIFLFYSGALFAYFVVFPIVFSFFTSTAPEGVMVMTDIGKYLDFVLTMIFSFAFCFEIPILIYLLIWSEITTAESISKKRPYIVILCFVVAMLLTPPDVLSQTLLAIPCWLLFEVGLLMARLTQKK